MPVLDTEKLIEHRTHAIRSFHEGIGNMKAELDLSGGVDSAVMCGLLAKALGPENVLCVYSDIDSDPQSYFRAREVAHVFGVRLVVLDLTATFEQLWNSMVDAYLGSYEDMDQRIVAKNTLYDRMGVDGTIQGGFRSCIRAPIGRAFNRIFGGGVRHGTGNECEDRWLRFYQKGGDGEVDCNAIAMLSKGEVYQLAVALGVPGIVIEALPTPDLWGKGEEHNDEDELLAWAGAPFTYSRVNPETGEYVSVGTIERVSRFLDHRVTNKANWDVPMTFSIQSWLFGQDEPDWPRIVAVAQGGYPDDLDHPLGERYPKVFDGIERSKVWNLLQAARRVERLTRHKANPNCPSLGTRRCLLDQNILTNTLPDLDSGEGETS